jgi:hypothetical protein
VLLSRQLGVAPLRPSSLGRRGVRGLGQKSGQVWALLQRPVRDNRTSATNLMKEKGSVWVEPENGRCVGDGHALGRRNSATDPIKEQGGVWVGQGKSGAVEIGSDEREWRWGA